MLLLVAGCVVLPNPKGAPCSQSGACPDGYTCFPDARCYPYDAHPPCNPPCYGAEPLCDQAALRCVECLADGDCEAGFVCALQVRRCTPGCTAARPECPMGQRCDVEAGTCVGQGCTDDTACTMAGRPRCDVRTGLCVPCLPGGADCSAGTFCTASSGTFRCVQGCNTVSDCPANGPNQVPACCDHRCVDVLASAEHCGACGNPCQNNDSCCDGVCFDLTRSAEHCGGCGRSCYLPNVTGVRCADSKCSNQGCEQYFGNCDGNLQSNGCEENHSFSSLHCGNCFHPCPGQPNRPGVCVLLSCRPGPCAAGWEDCDGQAFNGCERRLGTTTDCGGCNRPCAPNQTCVDGACR